MKVKKMFSSELAGIIVVNHSHSVVTAVAKLYSLKILNKWGKTAVAQYVTNKS